MDADRFDRWTRLLAARMSRRTAAASLGAAAVASLAAPRWTLGQDADVDQHKDNPTGDEPDDDDQTNSSDDDNQSDDDGGDDGGGDTSDDGEDDTNNDENLDLVVCLPITRCMREHCTDNTGMDGSGECHWDDMGPIPGGPYPQKWVWDIPPCTLKDANWDDLTAKCNAAYPGNNCPHCCNNECLPCTELSLAFCH